MKIDKNFWKNSKVLVTGHSGFKGFWLCNYLKILNAKVYGVSLEKNKYFNYKNIVEKQFFINLTNKQKLNKIINEVKPTIIFHFAAQSLVSEGYKDPTNTYLSNLIGTSNLLEICKKKKTIKSLLIITSDKCYKIRKTIYPFKESDEISGDDPYSASKACQEIIAWSFAKSFYHNKNKYNIATCRAGNIIGGGDFSKNRLIPDIIKSLFLNKKLQHLALHLQISKWRFQNSYNLHYLDYQQRYRLGIIISQKSGLLGSYLFLLAYPC